VAIGFIDALLKRTYRTHVRELEGLLWQALVQGSRRELDRPSRTPEAGASARGESGTPPPRRKAPSLSTIESALAANDGSLELTWRALGLSSRHALARLMAKYGIRKPKA
jgi:two-component system nitrogen regulation response regulator GlnG/two-component system response regulator HydG